MPMRVFTVTGIWTTSRIALTQSATRGLAHQAGAEAAVLDAIRRAAHVEVDLVISRAPRPVWHSGPDPPGCCLPAAGGEGCSCFRCSPDSPFAVDDGARWSPSRYTLAGSGGSSDGGSIGTPIGPVQHGRMEKRCRLHKNHPGWPNKGGFYQT